MESHSSSHWNKWLKFLVYAVVIFAYIIFFGEIYELEEFKSNGNSNTQFSLVILLLGNFIFGLILGFEHLLSEIKAEGKWHFNLPRFLFIGLPSLFLGLYIFIYFSNLPVLSAVTCILPTSFTGTWSMTLSEILFGYVLITSFIRQKNPRTHF